MPRGKVESRELKVKSKSLNTEATELGTRRARRIWRIEWQELVLAGRFPSVVRASGPYNGEDSG